MGFIISHVGKCDKVTECRNGNKRDKCYAVSTGTTVKSLYFVAACRTSVNKFLEMSNKLFIKTSNGHILGTKFIHGMGEKYS
jgi:hypothetical protein